METIFSYLGGNQLVAFYEISLAALLGALIGWERESKGRSAGLCTHALIASVCCAFAELVNFVFTSALETYPLETIRVEPAAVVEAAIIALGFVAGGAIIKIANEGKVINLTTACTILWAGAVGVLVGYRLIPLAVLSSLLVLAINYFGTLLETKVIGSKTPEHTS